MHNTLKVTLVAAVALLCAACHPEQEPVRELNTLTQRLADTESWSAADWDDALTYYHEIDETIAQYEYSQEERAQVDSLQNVCRSAFLSHDWGETVPEAMLRSLMSVGLR